MPFAATGDYVGHQLSPAWEAAVAKRESKEAEGLPFMVCIGATSHGDAGIKEEPMW